MITRIILLCLCGVSFAEDPVVCFGMGCVRGKSFAGNVKPFEGFFGIPFVKQPVGELRLKDPEPLTEKFNDIYNATEEKPFCIQKNYLLPEPIVMGNEDCLYLYVYRPVNWQRKNRKLLPVIVYIHGGAFFAGAAGPSLTGGDYLMDTEDVIFVTMSYRLGPLGFLSTGDASMSGNFGLKDQAMAIEWVRQHIDAFGGDPENIALMGQSAGASSIQLHMMSPWSRGNFHRVIMLSGSGIAPYAYVIQDPLKQARQHAIASDVKNVSEMSTEELAEALRNVDTKKLLDATDSFKIWSIDPLTVARPVVEDCSKVRGFLCDDPLLLWKSGNYARIPVLTGYMEGDGGVRALAYFEDQELLSELNAKFDNLIPKLMEIESETSPEVTRRRFEKIKEKYFNGESKLSVAQLKSVVKIYTDRAFLVPMADTLLQMVENDPRSAAYMYKFAFPGPRSYSLLYTGTLKKFGVVHADELIYLLRSPMLFPKEFEVGSREALFRAKFVKFITYFAANGKPPKVNNKSLQRCTKNESVFTGSRQLKCSFVEFDEKITIKQDGGIDNDAVDFWHDIDNTVAA